ncbi:MAG: hypothetical protein WBE76_20885 [Terracidiphilus sp.]
MRKFPAAAIAAITLGLTFAGSTLAVAQLGSAQHKKTIGYQDENGVFHPLAHAIPDAATPPTIGKYEVTFEITLASTFPKGAVIGCEIVIDNFNELVTTTAPFEATIDYEEIATGSVSATGPHATCTASMPYSWAIPAAPKGGKLTSTVSGSYTVSAYNPSTTITVSTIEGLRSVSSSLAIPAKVPKDGTTTPVTVDATL